MTTPPTTDVTTVRRDLGAASQIWEKVHDVHSKQTWNDRAAGRVTAEVVQDASAAALMASGYSYALAAVLRIIDERCGGSSPIPTFVAGEVARILADGDVAEWNEDLTGQDGHPDLLTGLVGERYGV